MSSTSHRFGPESHQPLVAPPQNGSSISLPDSRALAELKDLRDEFTRFMMRYKFGMDEITTKISILREEFSHLHDYNPIEHVSSRLKSPESIIDKIRRKGCDPSFDAIRETITDIAGVRVTCSFISDTHRIFDMLTSQEDIRVVQVKDYISAPKPNGYRSLHGILEIPVFLSDGVVPVYVEIQIRTIAMDFWASLEHKIYYKYHKDIPAELVQDLATAAETAAHLDDTMERLHGEVQQLDHPAESAPAKDPAAPDLVPRDHVLHQLRQVRDRFNGR